jgi:SsrA-binding protein
MTFATNPRAHFDYEILETMEAGLQLKGFEVKAIRDGKVSLKSTYVKILGGEAWLIGATISPYQPGNAPQDYDPQRTRKLLLHRRELNYLIGKSEEPGITIVPVKLYQKNRLIKLEIGIGRGKKKADKRETITKREVERTIRRSLKS